MPEVSRTWLHGPEGMADAAVSIGPHLRALAVYLVAFQHVPIERCAGMIADATGAEVSAEFVHSCLAKAAEVAADVVKLVKTLITTAHVPVGFQNSATSLDLGFYAARSYSFMRPPRTGQRLIRSWERSATGWSGRGGWSWRLRWGRRPL